MKVEIPNGEIVDKITILSIKMSQIKDEEKLKNVKKEYDCLMKFLEKIGINEESFLYQRLFIINRELWDIEDNIRNKEKKKEFDEEFIFLARKVYITNDERCRIKKEINIKTGSDFVEEKSYEEY